MIYFEDIKLKTHPEVYVPCDDSFLLAENLRVQEEDEVLDVGTGTGILAIVAAKKAEFILATDINPQALELANENARLNGMKNVKFLESDLFEKINGKFDLVIFNAPYLPSFENDPLGRAWSGGKDGTAVIKKFLENVSEHLKANGRIQMLVSSITNFEKIESAAKKNNLKVKILAQKRNFFETFYVLLFER